ncbi:MAG: hypothetical protein ACSHXD_17715 [Marinosulfonomonas sp.]
MSKHSDWDFSQDAPPSGLSAPVQALWWIGKGDWQLGPAWEQAHEICQTREGDMAHDWVHALAHWIEGDEFNSGYWYRRAGQDRVSEDAKVEWSHILNQLG